MDRDIHFTSNLSLVNTPFTILMKKNYLRNSKPGLTGRLWALLAFLWFVPLLGQAQQVTLTPDGPNLNSGANSASNPQYFGSVEVGASSASKSYTVAATDLDPNGSVSIVIPAGFQGSTNNVSFSTNTIMLVANATGNLSNTTVYLRFAPTSGAGTTINRAIFAQSTFDGGPVFSSPSIRLRGDAIAGSPNITVTPASLGFGNQTVGTSSAPMMVEVNATSLDADILVTAPAGFEVAASGSGTYAQTLTLTRSTANNSVNAFVDVRFVPTAARDYVAQVSFESNGATTRNVNVSGTGVLPPASLSAAPVRLDFTTLQAGQVSAPQDFTITGENITSDVVVSAPNGYLIRLGSSGTFVRTVTLSPISNQVNAVLQARFAPTAAGSYNSAITATTTGNGGANTSVIVTGQATAAPTGPFIVVSPTNLDFQTVTASGSAQTLAFSINAGNLAAPLVLTGSNNNIVFRDASAGGSFVNGPITINPAPDGTVSLREIEVRLVAPVPSGAFAGSITATSTGADPRVVTIQANAISGNSTINIEGVLAQFSTVPGIPSDVQSYFVTGTNLLQDLRIAAPQFFQVSLDPTFASVVGTGNSFSITPRSNGEVPRTEVFVRFLPPSALTITDVIINSSSPATSQAVQANGTSEPSIQIVSQFVEVRNVVLNTTSASQAITINAKRVLQPVTISKLLTPSSLNVNNEQQFQLSLDNVTFSNSIVLTPNSSTYEVNQQIFVRYRPTYLGTGQSTLQFQSNDFANKSTQSFGANDLLSGRSIDVEPTLRIIADVKRDDADKTKAIVTFNLPANYAALGYGEGRLIVASESATLPSVNQPIDGTPYTTGNQTYGAGPQIAPGYFVVYSGANNSVIIDGLNPAVTYYFYTFEYNNIQNNLNIAVPGAENYLSPPTPNFIQGIEAPGNPPLPVTLVSFSAKASGAQVAIRWETASELNNKQFEVERSLDSRTFETVLTRAGQGTTNAATVYNEVDRQPLNGLSYYRLKQVDLDGKTSYSSIVPVSFLKAGEVVMYPNPVADQLTITMNGGTEGVSVTITDLSGRTIQAQQLRADGKLDMANLKAGTYLVTVGKGNAKVTRRIVKQ
ncbi:T9SS type A sorting domain-containing protein [Hymenobacter terrestris]|uniref:T9SS type A sorting domain-containing protein n=1 Tax=Hymenobacter terrestris TaxID=2748310 RepID=A0ABX2Q4U3_9BACT|nr:T9SS type A sorting domain-containing protein [Hymenobacter terrestris]NVO84749.1 T9SS type A sorting domain-containing protein [Hymenobacter terrestris]